MNTSGCKILHLQRNRDFGHRLTTFQLLTYVSNRYSDLKCQKLKGSSCRSCQALKRAHTSSGTVITTTAAPVIPLLT